MQQSAAAPDEPGASRPRLILGAAALGYLSFLMSGNATTLPQLFFQRHHPEGKRLLLALCLLCATAASTTGVLLSARAARRREARRRSVVVGLALVTLAAQLLFAVREAWAYVALTATVQLFDNYLLARIDQAAVARARASLGRFNDSAGNGARLLGMLAAPAFFSSLYDSRAVVLWVITGLNAVAIVGASWLLRAPSTEGSVLPAAARPRAPLSKADRLFFGYAITIYASLLLLLANVIYLMRDVEQMERAEQRGGQAVVMAFAGALFANVLLPVLRARLGASPPPSPWRPRLPSLLAPAVALVGTAVGLLLLHRINVALLLAGAAVLGFTYGAFLLEVREYASRGAREQGKGGLLTLFNNMANLSSLGGFAVLLLLSLLRGASADYTPTLLLIGALPLIGLPLLISSQRRG